MNKKLIVLSLFDGMSCGQIALKELDHNVKYYASEIDKFAIQQTQHNFPDTIQLGDITKWKEWDIDWTKIDLVLAGSPCQGFSFAGKQLNFSDPRSALFFVFVDILNHVKKKNPDVQFLLENVNMKKEYLRIISEYVGLFPAKINSNLVSAQNRDRWYWSNIRTKENGLFRELWTDIPQPEDKGILLKDILQDEVDIDEKYYLSNVAIKRMLTKEYSRPKIEPDKTGSLNTKNNSGQCSFDSGTTLIKGVLNDKGNLRETNQSTCIDANYHKGVDNHAQRTIICVAKDNLIMQINPSKESNGTQSYQQNRIYDTGGQMPAICSENRGNIKIGYKLRRLTPIECAQLQTIPRWYKWKCSDTQTYRMLGNGWTVEIIKHILSFFNQ